MYMWLIRKSDMFVKDKAKIQAEWKASSEELCILASIVLTVRNVWVQVECVERKAELRVICTIKVVVKGQGTDQRTERGSVHDEE